MQTSTAPNTSDDQPGHRERIEWPAEWEPHEACWLAWPSHPEEWLDDLEPPRRCVAELCAAIADVDPTTGQARGERIELLVLDDEGEASARALLGSVPVRYHRIPFGDIWLRDTGPIFVRGPEGPLAACFQVNGWGGKYLFADDPAVAGRIAERTGVRPSRHEWILEGGGIDGDGQGTALTTRQCLLNPNRNPHLDQAAIEDRLARALGIRTLIWLDRGLLNDHTDGHVDNLARFVAPGRVVCMRARETGDPNREVLDEIARDLARARDAAGRSLEIVELPSPGEVKGPDGTLQPASYMNFYLGNRTVVVPVYGTAHDDEAVRMLASVFPGRRTVGVDARGLLVGGGAFHCISREQPRLARAAGQEQP